jgi:hypothetical protein
MGQEEKILQISGSGEFVYALSSEGKLYLGKNDEKKGFEWRKLPEMDFANMKNVRPFGTAEEESSQPVFAVPGGEIKTATIIRDDVVPDAAPPPAETAEQKK